VTRTSTRLFLLVALLTMLALLPGTTASAQGTAAKACTLTGTNLYSCTYTITPGTATGPGDWLVQMSSGPGTFTSAPTAVSATGCSTAPAINPVGGFISSNFGYANYDVTIGAGGCLSTAVVTVTESISVTASGQVCQSVWITTMSPGVMGCATVTYTPPPVASATKICPQTAAQIPLNQFTCIFTITPGVALGPGELPVQMVSGGPGTFVSIPTTVSATGCTTPPTISPGAYISSSIGWANYDVTIGAGGCLSSAVITVTETVVVTASGQVCQTVWLAAFSITACGSVTFVPPTTSGPSAVKTCTQTLAQAAQNVYSCLFTVTPGFPAAAGTPGDIIHVNEPPINPNPMAGIGTFTSTPTVVSVNGCSMGEVASPVTLTSSATAYNAQLSGPGCPGTSWSVTFSETIAVTASGQLCQSFYMVTSVPPTTACATVVFVRPTTGATATKTCALTSTPNIYTCSFTITPGAAATPGTAWLVQMDSSTPGSFTTPSPVVSPSTSGCGSGTSLPTVTPGTLISSQYGTANYDVTVGSAGCTAAAVVVITETVAVTASGQICQTVWISVASPGITTCAPCAFTCPCAAPTTPAAQTVTSTKTGVYCFIYSGPTVPVANFVTVFTTGVNAVNLITLPDGTYNSWFRLAPGLATITVLNNGDLICITATPGTAVFN